MAKKKLIGLMLALLCLSVVLFAGCASKQATVKSEATITDDAAAKAASEKAQKDRDQKDAALRAQAEKDRKLKDREVKVSANTGVEKKTNDVVKDIHFDFDMYAIRPADRDILLQNANYFLANKNVKIAIEGYCDEKGTAEYNLALGQRRADEAKKYLTAVGVDKSKMETISYGKEKPVDTGHNEEAWAKNRRAHFIVK